MTLGRTAFAALILQVAAQAQTGIVSTIAGRGERGYDGDGGMAVMAALGLANFNNQPCDPNRFEQTNHVSVDAQGNVYLADARNQPARGFDPPAGAAPAA